MRPGTLIATAADVQHLWQQLMGPGGFGRRTLWLVLLDEDARTSEVIMPIDDIPEHPDVRTISTLADVVADAEVPAVLLLLSRPGSATMTAGDRAWARALTRGFGARSPWPVHLATHDRVRVFAADDLLAAG